MSPRTRKPPAHRLTIYLLREDVDEFRDALVAPDELSCAGAGEETGLEGVLYYEQRHPFTPGWVAYVQPALNEQIEQVFGASSAAVLLLRSADRVFAVVFGFGKSFLDLEKVERRFGLRVTLNMVEHSELRSLDTKTLEDMIVSKRTQTSRSAELPAFGVDVTRDVLRTATGKPRDESFAVSLSGADALVISTRTEVLDLAAKCAELLEVFARDDYKENFGWIDHLTQVSSASLVQELDSLLTSDLRARVTDKIHMAPPDPLPWDEVAGFSFKIGGSGAVVYDDLDVADYLANVEGVEALTPQLLRQRRVRVQYARTGDFDDRWSVYRCLVAEYEVNGDHYVLTEGEWFRVDRTLLDRVNRFLTTLEGSTVALPPAVKGQVEAEYNAQLAPSDSVEYLLLDQKIPRPGGASSGVEPCDVLTCTGEFIHIKRKARSATLSHLFSQGAVAMTALREDEEYRSKLRVAIRDRAGDRDPKPWLDYVPENWPSGFASELKVTFAVVAEGEGDAYSWMPFFSKLNLMQHASQLSLVGARVGLVRIPVAPS